MNRHILDTPLTRSGERLRAYLRIARREHSLADRAAIYRAAGRTAGTERVPQFLRIARGIRA
jgi:hypothetical protein